MRRFLRNGPDVLVGARGSNRISETRLVRHGQYAVVADDDKRGVDFAASPQWTEVDDDGNPLTPPPPPPEPATMPAPPAPSEPTVFFTYPATTTIEPRKKHREESTDAGGGDNNA